MFVQAIPPPKRWGGYTSPPPPGIYASGVCVCVNGYKYVNVYEGFGRKTEYSPFGHLSI